MTNTQIRSGDRTVMTTTPAIVRTPPRWPLLLIALPAAIAIWSGWVGLGEMTGFGPVRLLPGIADSFEINSAITLPIGVEVYASYSLFVWLSGRIHAPRTVTFAKWSALSALVLGSFGQVVFHLLAAAHITAAPWPVTVGVATLPVAVLAAAASLAHMISREHGEIRTEFDPELAEVPEPVQATVVRADQPTPEPEPVKELEPGTAEWTRIAEALYAADRRRSPEKIADTLRLKFGQGWSHVRIAEHVGCSVSTVTRTVNAARPYLDDEQASHESDRA